MKKTNILLILFSLFIFVGCTYQPEIIDDITKEEPKTTDVLYWGVEDNILYISASECEKANIMDKYVTSSEYDYDVPWYIPIYGERNDHIKKVVILESKNKITPVSTAYWFSGMLDLESIEGLENIDTSKVTNMSNMFSYCKKLTSIELKSFDTSNVIDMSCMFRFCSLLESLDVSSFNTSNVKNMNGLFSWVGLETLDLSNFDTSNVTNMSYMFDGIYLKTLDLSNFDTSNVTDMSGMFQNLLLKTLDLSNFDTSKVTNMSYMFDGMLFLEHLNISSFDTSNVKSVLFMFGNPSNYTKCIDITHLDMSSVENDYEIDSLFTEHF